MSEALSHPAVPAAGMHPLASAHLPSFLPGPDGSDPMMTSVLIGLILILTAAGSFYLHLHSLPERMAHSRNAKHMELVAVLCLLALFTHNNLFWVAALVLVFLPMPDVVTPLMSIARSLRRLSGQPLQPSEAAAASAHGASATASRPEADGRAILDAGPLGGTREDGQPLPVDQIANAVSGHVTLDPEEEGKLGAQGLSGKGGSSHV